MKAVETSKNAMLDVHPLGFCRLDADALKAFLALVEHLHVGREGSPWCARAVQALDRGSFFVADGRTLKDCSFADIVSLTADAFVRRCPSPKTVRFSEESLFNTLTVLLPDGVACDAAESLLQEERPALLRRGLMAGFLHPQSTHRPLTPGPDGAPYRTDSPFLTIRWAVPEDELFVGINLELRGLLRAWIRGRQVDQGTTE